MLNDWSIPYQCTTKDVLELIAGKLLYKVYHDLQPPLSSPNEISPRFMFFTGRAQHEPLLSSFTYWSYQLAIHTYFLLQKWPSIKFGADQNKSHLLWDEPRAAWTLHTIRKARCTLPLPEQNFSRNCLSFFTTSWTWWITTLATVILAIDPASTAPYCLQWTLSTIWDTTSWILTIKALHRGMEEILFPFLQEILDGAWRKVQ